MSRIYRIVPENGCVICVGKCAKSQQAIILTEALDLKAAVNEDLMSFAELGGASMNQAETGEHEDYEA
jgi:Ni,Fe-hydrogenase III small subunit